MKNVLPLCVLALSAVGCASMLASLDEASKGPPPNLSTLAPGPGWTCYTASQAAWSGCWRTQAECEENRAGNAEEGAKEKIQFGACQPGLQAYCLSFDKLEMQSNGSGKYITTVECSPDERQCNEYRESVSHQAGNMAVSACALVK